MLPSLYVPIYSDDGEFKGYHIAEGAPKTIKRHFEIDLLVAAKP